MSDDLARHHRVEVEARPRSPRLAISGKSSLGDRVAAVGDEQVHLVRVGGAVRAVPGERDLARHGRHADRDRGTGESQHLDGLRDALGRGPIASKATSTPSPPVSSRTASTASPADASTTSVAPNPRSPLRTSPARRRPRSAESRRRPAHPASAASPMPPRPITATVAPGQTLAVWIGGADAGRDAAPEQARALTAAARRASTTTCGSVTTVWVASVPQSSTPVSTSPLAARRKRGG